MQVKPETAKEVGVEPSNLSDPYHNILAGAAYPAKQYNRFNKSWGLAFAAYYMGPERIKNPERLTKSELGHMIQYLSRMNKYIKMYGDIH